MKETRREVVVVTDYATDFGTKFTNKELCRECEIQEYKQVYFSLYNIANDKQRVLLTAMINELGEHFSSAYCEQSIGNDSLSELVESLMHRYDDAPF